MQRDYLLSNKIYERLKWVVAVVLPAVATFYISLADLWDLPNALAVAGTCTALATFGGVLLGVSTRSWNQSDGKYDGTIVVGSADDLSGNPDIQLTINNDPNVLAEKRTVRLRSIDSR